MKWHLIAACSCLTGDYEGDRAKFFLLVLDFIIRDNGHKWWLERF